MKKKSVYDVWIKNDGLLYRNVKDWKAVGGILSFEDSRGNQVVLGSAVAWMVVERKSKR